MGYHPRQEWGIYYRSAPFLVLPEEALAERSTNFATYYNGSIISYVVGEFFVQVVHGPTDFGIERWVFPALPDGGSLRRIWPLSTFDVVWPPQAMSEKDVEVAFNLFRDFIARTGREVRAYKLSR